MSSSVFIIPTMHRSACEFPSNQETPDDLVITPILKKGDHVQCYELLQANLLLVLFLKVLDPPKIVFDHESPTISILFYH